LAIIYALSVEHDRFRLDTSRKHRRDRWRFRATGPPLARLTCDARTLRCTMTHRNAPEQSWDNPGDALDALVQHPELSLGRRWVGWLSYDLGRIFETLDDAPIDELRLPLFDFVLLPGESADSEPRPGIARIISAPPRSTFTRDGFESAVERAIRYISAGDIFQVNLAQRFTAPHPGNPLETYARLHARTPAAYGAYLDFGGYQLLSNSPELFFDVSPGADGGAQIVNRPIKGTRPRRVGMREALRDSEKDKAELAMIVDLQRNDLSRVCEVGSVRVVEARLIEAHPTVYHGVATVAGTLRRGTRFSQILAGVFPCGSITGCPKIRAMQIIDELEPVSRGPYCGAIGWIDGAGSMQFNVAIRTMVVIDGSAFFSTGAGIVADSSPTAEFDETMVKALAMLQALGATKGNR
jgi:para-aminobenzoate synthetase component 1